MYKKKTTQVFTTLLIILNLILFVKAEETKTEFLSIQEETNNILGLAYSAKKIEEATILLNKGNLQEAEKNLGLIKSWLTDGAEYHYNLFQVFSKDPKRFNQSKIEKAHALDFGNLRDQVTFLLAQTYIKQNKLKEAVKLLIEIIKSQPTTEFGKNTYKTLQEIKFSDKTDQ